MKSVQLAIEITTNAQEATAKHQAQQIEQEAKGKLERQRIQDEAAAEQARQELLKLQTQSQSCKYLAVWKFGFVFKISFFFKFHF